MEWLAWDGVGDDLGRKCGMFELAGFGLVLGVVG